MPINFQNSYPLITWDLNKKNLFFNYFGKKDDSARGFKVQILQDSDVLIPSTELLRLYCVKDDNTKVYADFTINNSLFICDLPSQIFAVVGTVECELQLSSNGDWVTSETFYIKVNNNLVDGSILSSDDFVALRDALDTVQQAVEDVNQAVSDVNQAITDTNTAIANANTATTSANNAATLANTKATLADQKATLANDKANLANTAASNANTATSNANTATTNANVATDRANTAAQAAEDVVAGIGLVLTSDKGIANGVASLDSSAKIPVAQMPTIIGNVDNLTTESKTNLVSAVNETVSQLATKANATDVNTALSTKIDNSNLSSSTSGQVLTSNGNGTASFKDSLSLDNTNTINYYSNKMLAGEAVSIRICGDSTYWSAVSGSDPVAQETETVAQTLQALLRSYYNNTLITVANDGHRGFQTTHALNGASTPEGTVLPWNELMATCPENIIFINYGINDAASYGVAPNVYRANLRELVKIARANNKTVVLDTSNVILNFNTSSAAAERTKQYAQIMREVAMEFNVPLVDNFKLTEQYLYNNPSKTSSLPDGIHPSAAMYKFKSAQMAGVFINHAHISTGDEQIIPCTNEAFKYSGASSYIQAFSNSKYGYCIMASYIKLAIYIDNPNTDIYLATGVWAGGHSNINVVLDNTVMQTMSIYDSYYTEYFMHDAEILVLKNLTKGFHIIEFNNSGSTNGTYIDCYYVKVKNSKRVQKVTTASLSNFKRVVNSYDGIQFTMSSTSVPFVLTDIPTSRIVEDLDIELTTTLHVNEGFLVMGSKNSAGNITCGLMIMATTSSEIAIYENTTGNTYNGTILNSSASSYVGTQHTFRIVATKTGTVTLYCDGVSIGTYTMTRNLNGGYLGFYKNSTGTMNVKNINVYE